MAVDIEGEAVTMDELLEDDFAFVNLDVDRPAIAWLAYRGMIVSNPLILKDHTAISWFYANIVQRGQESALRRERILEKSRRGFRPGPISRLEAIYAHPTLQDALRSQTDYQPFRRENLVAIEPVDTNFVIQRHDSTWIDDFDAGGEQAASNYWRGVPSGGPKWEALLWGRFFVLGTALRKRAYETIRKRAPQSLAILELSRLAAYFGSDLGAIAPFVVQSGSELKLTHIIKYDEAEGTAILKRALEERQRRPEFCVNDEDLETFRNPDPKYDRFNRVPDLSAEDRVFRADKAAILL